MRLETGIVDSKYFLFPAWLAAGGSSSLAAISTVPTAGQQRPARRSVTVSAAAPILCLSAKQPVIVVILNWKERLENPADI